MADPNNVQPVVQPVVHPVAQPVDPIQLLTAGLDRLANQSSTLDLRNALIRQTTPCDGQERSRFRTWLHDVSLAHRSAPDMATFVAMRTAMGPLRTEVESAADLWKNDDAQRAADPQIRRENAPWDEIAPYLTRIFLGGEEIERLRAELNQMVQKPYENSATYIVRFKEAADAAYPLPRNPVHETILRDTFLRGLSDDHLARHVITRANINTLQAACDAVTQRADATDRYNRVMAARMPIQQQNSAPRHEEAMEIGQIQKAQSDQIAQLCAAIKHLTDKFDNSAATNANSNSQNQNRPRYNPPRQRSHGNGFTPRNGGQIPPNQQRNNTSGPKQCWHCGRPGHLRRNCFALQNQSQPNRNQNQS